MDMVVRFPYYPHHLVVRSPSYPHQMLVRPKCGADKSLPYEYTYYETDFDMKKLFSSNHWNPQFLCTAAALLKNGRMAVSQTHKKLQDMLRGHEECIFRPVTMR